MSRGGRRAGAGRKPGPKVGIVLGMDGNRRARGPELPPAVSGPEKEGLLVAPAGLSPGARQCWVLWAGLAVEERTLTPATAAGFGELCERWAYVTAIAARIEVLGPATQDALPYLSLYDRLAQKLEQSLARFKLTAFGKPATSDKPKAAANPWGAFGGQAK